MSDAVSALSGAQYQGIVQVRDMGLQGMVTLKANLDHDRTAAALKGVMGADMPDVRRILPTDQGSVVWMAPDELLVLCPHDQADAVAAGFQKKLKDRHHLAVNVSDARVMFELNGTAIRDVLAKLTPADLHSDSLKPGEMRRSRLAQVPVAFWFEDDTTLRLIAFRSVAQYVFDLLSMAAKPGG
ncbi:MAG: sarcosine oxidase subunit gamma family protein [Pseudomonadota bacterium]